MAADGGSFMRAAFIPAIQQLRLDIDEEIIVDGFAGAGGMSEAIYQAFDRHAFAALNHNADFLSVHARNNPCTNHWIGDIREACPHDVTRGRPVGLLHLSPECTHFSQARGGQPRDAKIRALAWVAIRWIGQVRPRVLTLENVTLMRRWGPLIAKRDKATGRVIKLVRVPKAGKKGKFKTIEVVAAPGERVRVQDQFLIPDPKRIGKTFRRFLQLMKVNGYEASAGELNAAEHGAGTSRNRLFIVARRDGAPIVWPSASHAKVPKKGQRAMRQAAEFLDFSAPAKSIFDRAKPLAENTLRRVAAGVERYVKGSDTPFIVPASRGCGSQFAADGELTVALLAQHNNNPGGSVNAGHSLREPMSALTGKCSHQQLVTVHLADVPKGAPHSNAPGVSASQWRGMRNVAAFLDRYLDTRRAGSEAERRKPMSAAEVMALVTVRIHGQVKVMVDVRQRMLSPREAMGCQGLPPSYVIERGHDDRRLSRAQQFKMIGNSVSPPPAIALLRANLPEWVPGRKLAKAA